MHAGGEGGIGGRAEDGSAEGVGRAVCDAYGVGRVGSAHEQADGREELRCGDCHLRCDCADEGGGEIVTVWMGGVRVG